MVGRWAECWHQTTTAFRLLESPSHVLRHIRWKRSLNQRKQHGSEENRGISLDKSEIIPGLLLLDYRLQLHGCMPNDWANIGFFLGYSLPPPRPLAPSNHAHFGIHWFWRKKRRIKWCFFDCERVFEFWIKPFWSGKVRNLLARNRMEASEFDESVSGC